MVLEEGATVEQIDKAATTFGPETQGRTRNVGAFEWGFHGIFMVISWDLNGDFMGFLW
jgi:hypothetical protein